jgi:chromosomal replication initiator protein
MAEIIDSVAKDIWERAKKIYISSLVTKEEQEQANRYFSMITSVSAKDGIYTICTSSSFAAEHLEDNYSSKLKTALLLAGANENCSLKFAVDEAAKPAIILPVKPPIPQHANERERFNTFESTMPLNDSYTFEEFVIGPSNSWAHAAAKGAASEPGKKGYNPLFIHGGTGLGKTHIMQAIGNEIRRKNPKASVCYLTAERFLNEYVNALRNTTIQQFRERYRKVDVLLVDDIQFMSRGKDFQEEFFNTFNALHQDGKQIVTTSDVAPKDLPGIEPRLISRFEWGMVQEIEVPSYETRLAILKKKAEAMVPTIPEETLIFIAHHIKSHVRAMEGALGKVNVLMNLDRSIRLNDDLLSHLLKDFIEKEKTQKRITIEEIQTAVANKYAVTLAQILSSERSASIVTPRQMAMYIARKFTTKSLPEIAKQFDKTHATILHGVKTIAKRLDVEPDLRDVLSSIISGFGYTMEDRID